MRKKNDDALERYIKRRYENYKEYSEEQRVKREALGLKIPLCSYEEYRKEFDEGDWYKRKIYIRNPKRNYRSPDEMDVGFATFLYIAAMIGSLIFNGRKNYLANNATICLYGKKS